MKNDIFNHLTVGNSAFSEVIEEGHGYITFPKLKGPLGPRMKFNGKEKIVWSLNDYLGLATDPKILKADQALAARYGFSYPMGSRIMSGNLDMHEELESALAAYVHKESAILLNYGYPGVVSSIDALLNRHDVVIYDEESHACIIDGVRLHRGKRMMFRHNDIDHLEKQLKRALDIVAVSGGGILVISEGVFSMRGDQGRLKEIVALKSRYPFRLFVDDAHGFGVLGPTGAGTPELQDVSDGVDFHFATFAKAMASVGAFLAADKKVIDYLYYNVRSQVFAKALPAVITAGALERLRVVQQESGRRKAMWDIANALREGLQSSGFTVGAGESPITPVFLKGSMENAKQLLISLREDFNIFCSGVIYPVVPKGTILYRLVATRNHSTEDVKDTIMAFELARNLLLSSN